MRFSDRQDAGTRLGEALRGYEERHQASVAGLPPDVELIAAPRPTR